LDRFRIALLPGDGVGQEVLPAGLRVLERAAQLDGSFALDCEQVPWGSQYYLEHGRMMPEDGLSILRRFDAIYLGAVGSPQVPDHVTLWGLLLPIRQRFNLYVNARPVKLFPGVTCPLRDKGPEDIDMLCIRENSEGEYAGVGGRVHTGFGHEVAIQADIFTRQGVEGVVRYAFDRARERRKHLSSITKSNASPFSFVLWDEIVNEVAAEYPDVTVSRILVDAAAAYFITRPEIFDVVVASNLFGDILTDIAAAIARTHMANPATSAAAPVSRATRAPARGRPGVPQSLRFPAFFSRAWKRAAASLFRRRCSAVNSSARSAGVFFAGRGGVFGDRS